MFHIEFRLALPLEKRSNFLGALQDSHLDKLTFYGLYEEWLEYKKTVTNGPNTIKRHTLHYKKFFEPSALHDKRIRKIDELLLETECNRIVKEFDLFRKEWCNAKTILNGMFDYTVRKNTWQRIR